MGFTKLDERILQSSIMAEAPATFKVWIALLAACRPNGIAYVSAIYLSSICHLPISTVETALTKLSSPDKHSRTLAEEGRRIQRVDGGYEIINYGLYRERSVREIERERKRKQRAGESVLDSPGQSRTVPGLSASASASASDLKEGVKGEIQTAWNDFASKWELPTIQDIKPGSTRERHLLNRMKESGFDFKALLQKIERQPFLLGKNPNAWAITFDWILLPSNYQKIIEETYPARHVRDSRLDNPKIGSEAHYEAAKARASQKPESLPESYLKAREAQTRDKQ